MSGFLRRLVERHATEPVTRPRALSRFEAGAPPIGGPPQELSVPASLPEDPPSAPVRGTAGPPADPPPAPLVLRSSPGEARPAAPALPGPTPPEAAFASLRTVFERTDAGRPIAPREPLAGPPRDAEPSVDPATTLRPAHGVGPIVPRKVLVPARADVRATGRLRNAGDPAGHGPDVVRVHIGRVEVRAVLPPAERPTPRPRGTTGPLPLDRYLARRERP